MRRTLTTLLCALALLLAFGVVLLYSASMAQHRTPHFYLERQLKWLAAGLPAGWLMARIDYHIWRRDAALVTLLAFMVAGLLSVFLFPETNGSHRWLRLGPASLQPSEFVKIAAIVAMAAWLDRIGPRVRGFWKGAVAPGLGLACVLGLLILEPDYGATLVTGMVGGTVMLVAGTRLPYLLLGGAGGGAVFASLLYLDPVRRPRLLAFLSMIKGEKVVATEGYQLEQSINAFIAGGPWGVGLNHSIQKYYYLPEAHTDFIFAIAGEEFGLIATAGVVLLFGTILVCGMLIACHAADRFGRLLAVGITVLLIFAAGFNMGVVTGCLPTKGLALPFVSYGGSSLLASLMAIGLLVNVARHVDSDEARHIRNALHRI